MSAVGRKQGLRERKLMALADFEASGKFSACFDHAFGIEAEGFSEGAFCPMPVRTAQ